MKLSCERQMMHSIEFSSFYVLTIPYSNITFITVFECVCGCVSTTIDQNRKKKRKKKHHLIAVEVNPWLNFRL